MEAKANIGVVLVGAGGNRGRCALEMLPKLRVAESANGINLVLIGMAEAKQSLRAGLAVQAQALLEAPCPVFGRLTEAIPLARAWAAEGHGGRSVIVYDATPTAQHYLHLMSVLPHSQEERMYYFGEKPLFTKQGEIEFIERNFPGQTFFCEFIETENPAFRAAQNFIRSSGMQVQRMHFWRASCMGVLVAAGDGRGGVEGGALLDKAPHDLSVAVGLLGPDALQQWLVDYARVHLLALHEDALRLGQRNFLTIANTPVRDIDPPPRIPEELPAEALVSFGVTLKLRANISVPVSFLASWVGVQDTHIERTLSAKLGSLGLHKKEWLNTEERHISRNSNYCWENEEVRLALVEGLLHNRPVTLVINLLAKFQGRRFVYLVDENLRREILFEEPQGCDYHGSKEADLLNVFKRVVEHCAGLSHAAHVGPHAALLVHKIMLRAMDKANDDVRRINPDEAYAASLAAYKKYLARLEAHVEHESPQLAQHK